MRILLVNTYHHHRGGDCTYAFHLKRLLESKGHEVVPFAMQHEKNVESPYSEFFVSEVDFQRSMQDGLSSRAVARLGGRMFYSAEARRRLRALIEKVQPDIAHLQNFRYHLTGSIVWELKKRRIPMLWTLHDYELLCPNSTLFSHGVPCEECNGHNYYNAARQRCKKDSFLASVAAGLEAYLQHFTNMVGNVSALISPSAFLRNKLIGAGYGAHRVVHLPNFLFASETTPQYTGQPYIVYVGRLAKEKGIDTLIRSASGFRHLAVKIIGEGPERSHLESLVSRLGLTNVQFLGQCSPSDTRQTVRNCLFTVLPSIWFENFPYTVLESFTLGKPVVASDIGGIPEIVDHGENGFLVRPGDMEQLREAIVELVAENAMRENMGRNAVLKVRRMYDAELHYTRLVQIYQSVLFPRTVRVETAETPTSLPAAASIPVFEPILQRPQSEIQQVRVDA